MKIIEIVTECVHCGDTKKLPIPTNDLGVFKKAIIIPKCLCSSKRDFRIASIDMVNYKACKYEGDDTNGKEK